MCTFLCVSTPGISTLNVTPVCGVYPLVAYQLWKQPIVDQWINAADWGYIKRSYKVNDTLHGSKVSVLFGSCVDV